MIVRDGLNFDSNAHSNFQRKETRKKPTTFEHTLHRSKHARPSIEKGAVSVCAVHRMNVNENLRVTQINEIIVHFVFLIKN